jgi:hypothetical protein
MVVSCLLDRLSVRLIVSLAAAVVACGDRDSARAFDFFGLWGSDEIPPPVSRTAISYAVTIDVTRDDNGLKNAVQDASSLDVTRWGRCKRGIERWHRSRMEYK